MVENHARIKKKKMYCKIDQRFFPDENQDKREKKEIEKRKKIDSHDIIIS